MGGYLGNSLFMLLTGYFSITKKVSWKRLLLLALAMIFYSVSIAIAWKITGNEVHGWKNILLPFLHSYNWFVACYLVFMCFVPYLNPFLKGLTKPRYAWLLILSFAFYNIFPVLNWSTFMNSAPLFQFFLMYSIGGYLRLYGFQHLKLKDVSTWVALTFVFLALQDIIILQRWLAHKNIWKYVPIISTFLAVSMFMVAATCKSICIPWVNRLSASVLGVYLIHDNPIVRPFIWRKIFPNTELLQETHFIEYFLIKVLLVYGLCLCIDQLRLLIVETPLKKWIDLHWENWIKIFQKQQMKWVKRLENL